MTDIELIISAENPKELKMQGVSLKGDPGEPGKTPQRGIDYWTPEDKEKVIEEATKGAEEAVQAMGADLEKKIDTKANKGDVYTKEETNTALDKKLDAGTEKNYVSSIGILGATEVNGEIINNITISDKNGNFTDKNLFTADQAPTRESANLITSGAVYDAVEEVSAIAKGRATGLVFDSFDSMDGWLKSEECKGVLQQGDNLYLKDVGVPDYWVSAVLTEPDAETGYYYEIAPLETQKVDLDEYVKNKDYATGEKGGVVKVDLRENNPYGIHLSNGMLRISCANNTDITNKASYAKPIVPAMLDYAVQSCTNQDLDAELTEEQLKLPPSTQAFKAAIGDINTALENIITKYGLGGDGV